MNIRKMLALGLMGGGAAFIPPNFDAVATVKDTFTGSDNTTLVSHTMDIGNGWTGQTIPKIVGNKATALSDMGKLCTVTDIGRSDGIISVDISGALNTDSGTFHLPGVVFRYTNDENYWNVYMFYKSIYMYKVVAGVITGVGHILKNFSDDTTYNIKINMQDEAIDLLIDDIMAVRVTGQTFNKTATKIGFVAPKAGSPAVSPTWDNLLVYPNTTAVLSRDFTKLVSYAGNPIIPYNAGAYNANGADTVYIRQEQKIGSTYYMVTQGDAALFKYDNLDLYTSTDLLTWTPHASNPVLTVTPNSWDHTYINHPSIVKINTDYYMYYGANDNAANSKVGLATSPDMITWTKYGDAAVYDQRAYGPCVIKIAALYYMYYWNCLTGLDYATSPDGITWTYGGPILRQRTGDWDVTYNNFGFDPWVILNKYGFYEMIYTVYKPSPAPAVQSFGYAVSSNGINWIKYNAAIMNASGIVGSYDETYIGDAVMFESGNTLYFYLAGVGPDNRPQGGVKRMRG